MFKLFRNALGLLAIGGIIVACEKENLTSDNPEKGDSTEQEVKTMAQSSEDKCYLKGVIYHGYIKCVDPGTNCEVKCEEDDSTPADVVQFFNSLNSSNNNTSIIQTFMASLNSIPQQIQQDIQSANYLHYLITSNGGTTSYGVLDSQGNLLYAFSY